MNRPMLIAVGLLVLVGVVIFIVSGPGPAGRFADAGSCSQLTAMFEAEPVSDNAAERRVVGDEYRAKADQLGCSI